MVNLVPSQGGGAGEGGGPALLSIYIGDNADCLTEGRLSSVCSCAHACPMPCLCLPTVCLVSGLPYVWPWPMPAHVWPARYLIVI
jgi:hypothetical protein